MGHELSKALSESQPSIHSALYQDMLMTSRPWMFEEKLSNYLELPLPQSPGSRMDDADDNSSNSGSSSSSSTPRNSSCVSLNVTCASNGHVPSIEPTPLHLDKQERYSALGYCNGDMSVAKEETACDIPFRRKETTHLSAEELNILPTHDAQVTVKNQGYTGPDNFVSMDEDELCTSDSEITYMDSSETINTDHAVIGNCAGHDKHNSMSPELSTNSIQNRATPLSFDMGASRKSSTNSIQPSALQEEPPTSPVVVFDFGVSTLNFQEEQSPDVILTLEENDGKDVIAFNFGSSQLEPNEDSSDAGELLHELPNFSLGFTLPDKLITLYPATVNGYVVDIPNGAHHDNTNAFFDFCNSTRCDRSDLYIFDKNLGEHNDSDQLSPLSLGEFSLSQTFPSTFSSPFFTSLVRSGYVSKL